MLATYNVGRRAGPPRIETANIYTTNEAQDSKTKNHIRLLTGFFTGFNIKIRSGIAVTKDTVSYLLTINAHATEVATVNEVFEQTHAIM